jgi:uncharacterized membrane protein
LRSQFRFNTFWLAAFYYANPLFVMGISLLIYAYFSGTQLGRKTRAGYIVISTRPSVHYNDSQFLDQFDYTWCCQPLNVLIHSGFDCSGLAAFISGDPVNC